MEAVNNLGKLSKSQLRSELVDVVHTLASRLRELAAIQADYNRSFYPAYAREPATSVAAKERAAEYACIEQLNDRILTEAEVRALTATRDLIVTLLTHAAD